MLLCCSAQCVETVPPIVHVGPIVDATAMLQAEIDRAAAGAQIRIAPGTYYAGNLVIADKHDVELIGDGVTIVWHGRPAGDGRVGIELRGQVSGVRISGFHLIGDGTLASRHAGVWSRSGQTLADVEIVGNEIEHVTLGISVNADLGGSLHRIRITDNRIDDVVGTESGYGYGIHVASSQSDPLDIEVTNNRITRTQRHAIYQARGQGVRIVGNTAGEHRQGVAIGAIRPAIVVARSHDIAVVDNVVQSHADGGILVTAAGVPTARIALLGNTLVDAANAVPSIIIGSQDPAKEGSPTEVVIERNEVVQDHGDPLRILGDDDTRLRDNILERRIR
ncbi:MAG TPA: NosD domain-containing protein [Nannocystaceae bacterium]|nr:NosD domain-containing protein [Nannocystaceae bacterium]